MAAASINDDRETLVAKRAAAEQWRKKFPFAPLVQVMAGDEIAAIDARLKKLDAIPKPPCPPSRFEHSLRNGFEVIAIKGWETRSRLIRGMCSTPALDKQNDHLLATGCNAKFPIPLFCSHKKGTALGEVVSLRKSEHGVFIVASVNEDDPGDCLWNLIAEDKDLRGLSIGWKALVPAADVDGVKFYSSWQLREVSITRAPANPTCTFEIMDSNSRQVAASRGNRSEDWADRDAHTVAISS